MAGNKVLLIENLLKLSLGEEIDTLDRDISDYVRASFLILSSHSVDSCALAERLAYETYEDDSTDEPFSVKGIGIPAASMLLIDVVDELMNLPNLPEGLAQAAPDLVYEDYRAALYAIRCILHSLQWHEYDSQHDKRYAPEMVKRLLKKSLDQIDSYRETGEP